MYARVHPIVSEQQLPNGLRCRTLRAAVREPLAAAPADDFPAMRDPLGDGEPVVEQRVVGRVGSNEYARSRSTFTSKRVAEYV